MSTRAGPTPPIWSRYRRLHRAASQVVRQAAVSVGRATVSVGYDLRYLGAMFHVPPLIELEETEGERPVEARRRWRPDD